MPHKKRASKSKVKADVGPKQQKPAVGKVDVDAAEQARSEVLPTELLLLVLKHLEKVELLRARAVCRQWRDAALDPSLWRSHHLYRHYTAVLRLAPCASSLFLDCQDSFRGLFRKPIYSRISEASVTRCAVEELDMLFGGAGTGFAALVIRNQESLGRLRAVKLRPWTMPVMNEVSVALLTHTLCRVEGLHRLDLDGYGDVREGHGEPWDTSRVPPPGRAVPASLRELVAAPWLPGAHLEFLLRCHAPTLERVTLRGGEAVGEPLARADNLAELTCPLMEDMTALLRCAQLSTLTLDVQKSASPTALREAGDYLRRAAALRDVTLRYHGELAGDQANLVRSLATSEHANLKKLTFVLVHKPDQHVAEVEVHMTERFTSAFSRTLPWLTALRELRVVGDAIGSLLDAVTPKSAPSLRLLTVHFGYEFKCEDVRTPCAHSFMHRVAVLAALKRNPRLHVKAVTRFADCSFRELVDDWCDWCFEERCHPLLHERYGPGYRDDGEDRFVTLYSHPDDDGACDVPHLSADHDQRQHAFAIAFSARDLPL